MTARLGAVTRMAIGVRLGGAVAFAMRGIGMTFALPVSSLIAFAVVGPLAGMVAASLPARRASRLPVLDALAYEWQPALQASRRRPARSRFGEAVPSGAASPCVSASS